MSEAAGGLESDALSPPAHYEVAVIGGGQAGLTMGYYLAQQGRRFIILERGDSVAPAWRERWDSLTLFTPRGYSALPGLPFPGDPDDYPTRDEVIAYLERYAEEFDLPIELNSNVRRLSREDDGRFVLELDGRTITADQVVVATGPFQTPYVPKLADELDPDVWQAHSTGYRRPCDVPQGTVLVVGGGNTGFQIAKELSTTHEVVLSVGSRQKPLPQRVAGRDLFWWLTKTGLINKTVESRLGQRLKDRDTLIGSSPRELTRRYGVELKPRAIRCFRAHRYLRGRKRGRGRRGYLGDGLPARLLLDRPADLRPGRTPAPPPRRNRRPGALLPRSHLAAHARLGPDRLGEG